MQTKFFFLIGLILTVVSACTSIKETQAIKNEDFSKSRVAANRVVAGIPDYTAQLSTVKGKGKAIISEPGNSDRATLYFSSNRQKSLITAKNSIGIEGGKLLTDGDSLLIYDRVNKYARKISVKNGSLHDINNLASVNLLQILNMPIAVKQVQQVFANADSYMLQLQSGAKVYVNKQSNLVRQVDQPASSNLPYSRIIYDAYKINDGLKLPRRMTIFSADKSSKIDLLIQSLQVNPELGELSIELPDDIKIDRQ